MSIPDGPLKGEGVFLSSNKPLRTKKKHIKYENQTDKQTKERRTDREK